MTTILLKNSDDMTRPFELIETDEDIHQVYLYYLYYAIWQYDKDLLKDPFVKLMFPKQATLNYKEILSSEYATWEDLSEKNIDYILDKSSLEEAVEQISAGISIASYSIIVHFGLKEGGIS